MYINEIFTSLSGECDGFGLQGGFATFIRLQGCNLECKWCDTVRARNCTGGKEMSIEEVMEQCTSRHIIITGGEPLCQQKEVDQLVDKLIKRSFPKDGRDFDEHVLVTIETNGSIPINIDKARARYNHIRFVVDYKLSSSGMGNSMLQSVFGRLYSLDVIKFVIADLQDHRQAKDILLLNPQWRARKVFSPVPKGNWPEELAKEMVRDKLENVQFSLQLHKMVNIL